MGWWNLLISTDKKLATPYLVLVIFVFSSDSSSFNTSRRNCLTLTKIVRQSSLDPLTPMIQSSAYLIYTSFLKFGSTCSLDFTCSRAFRIFIFSGMDFALYIALFNLFHWGLMLAVVPVSKSSFKLFTNSSNLSKNIFASIGLIIDP